MFEREFVCVKGEATQKRPFLISVSVPSFFDFGKDNWMLIAGAVLLVGLISVLYWYLLFYRKKKKYASLNEDYDILDFDKDDDF